MDARIQASLGKDSVKHEELKDKCRKAFGGKIPIDAKERWANFVRSQALEFTFRYDWIRDPRFYDWVRANSGPGKPLDISDGQEWFGVYVHEDFIKSQQDK